MNIMDTPGYFDFQGEVKAALRVADGAAVLVDASSGVEVGTELVWQYADENDLPKLVFINKLDRENTDFEEVVQELNSTFPENLVPLQVPIGQEEDLEGIVDLVEGKAFFCEDGERKEGEVPAHLTEQVEAYGLELTEMVAENDDDLLMKYLEGEDLTDEEVRQGLKKAILNGELVPVFCGSALKNVGVMSFMEAIVSYAPSPVDRGAVEGKAPEGDEVVSRKPSAEEPFSALVFKTMADPYVGKLTFFRVFSGTLDANTEVYNANRRVTERIGDIFQAQGGDQVSIEQAKPGDLVALAKLEETTTGDTICDPDSPVVYEGIEFPSPVFSVAVKPKSQGDEDKMGSGLNRLAEEDPTFTVERNRETLQTVMSGMGELHLDVMTARLERKFGVEVVKETPKVPYRETITSPVKTRYRHKKQSGGRGQYGEVYLEVKPLPRGEGFEFIDEIYGGAVPNQFIPAVEKGVEEAMEEGILAGYPVTDVSVTLYDGSHHSVDSSEMAFKIAASRAFTQAVEEDAPVLLEPIMDVRIIVSDEYMGDVMGDLNRKRGKIHGMEQQGSSRVVRAEVPLAEMFTYAIDLRSMTQGRGTYTMEFSHYQRVPRDVTKRILERKERESED